MLKLSKLRCNYEDAPKGVTGTPVFSWILHSQEPEVIQEAMHFCIYDGDKLLYDSGKIQTSQSVGYKPNDFITEPEKEYCWKITVWDNHGEEACEEARFEGTICEWHAKWVEPSNGGIGYEKPISVAAAAVLSAKPKGEPEQRMMPITFLRKTFSLKKAVYKARVYATAHGLYELQMNGKTLNESLLSPEYSAYDKCLYYQIYDITHVLQSGENACGIMLADGWWGGRCGMGGECYQYGNARGFLMQIQVEYEDGETEEIISDDAFHWMDQGYIRYSDLFIGEKQDMQLAYKTKGYSTTDYQENECWQKVLTKEYGYEQLMPQIGGGVKEIREFYPVLIQNPKGEHVLDFGQNFAGYVRVYLTEEAGTTITLEHAEMLNKKGNFFSNIMGVNKDQKDVFVCSGAEKECFQPRFTFHGFRYVKVSGLKEVNPSNFVGIAISTDMEELGAFSCSNEDLNQLYHNSRWSQYANMISIPTDCPQREKAGWTGDIQIYAPTAAYHQDMDAFLRRWMQSVKAEQRADGQIPPIIPYTASYQKILEGMFHGTNSAGWSDCCIIVPYVMYQMYQDTEILNQNYEVMNRWLAYVTNEAETKVSINFSKKKKKTPREIENQKYLWNTGFQFGDWYVPSYKGKDLTIQKKTEPIFAAMYYAYEIQLMVEISGILNYQEDEKHYTKLYQRIKEAFAETYVDENGVMAMDTQGCYVCALWLGLIPKPQVAGACTRLRQLIKENGNCLDTGFLTTPVLLDTLMEYGMTDMAYMLLYQEQCPSWLYEIRRGATTIWENWDAIKPNGKVSITSYCHYAFGCVSDFMHRRIVGIRKDAPGYQRIRICPEPDKSLSWAKGSHRSMYGMISCEWKREHGKFILDVEIPCNTEAVIQMPSGVCYEVKSGKHHFSEVQ